MKLTEEELSGIEEAKRIRNEKLNERYSEKREWEIWMSGYKCTGQSAEHEFVGKVEAFSFRNACFKAIVKWIGDNSQSPKEILDKLAYYDADYCRYWGCNLYDNESDASKAFG